MDCLNCGMPMEKGIIEGIGQGLEAWYEFTSDKERQKRGLKGFFTRKTIKINPHTLEDTHAWHCPNCKKILAWMNSDE